MKKPKKPVKLSAAEKLHTQEEEQALTVMPDPEAELEKAEPEKHRKGLPAGKLTMICDAEVDGKKCGNVSTVHVDDPESYDAARLQQVFSDRGGSYDPPRCHWCAKKAPAKRKSAGK